MPPLRFEEMMLAYIITTFFYLALVTLIVLVVTNVGRRLILLGVVTVVASISYGIVSMPSGTVVAPTMAKLGALMAFAGVVSWLLPQADCCGTGSTSKRRLTSDTQPDQPPSFSSEPEAWT